MGGREDDLALVKVESDLGGYSLNVDLDRSPSLLSVGPQPGEDLL